MTLADTPPALPDDIAPAVAEYGRRMREKQMQTREQARRALEREHERTRQIGRDLLRGPLAEAVERLDADAAESLDADAADELSYWFGLAYERGRKAGCRS